VGVCRKKLSLVQIDEITSYSNNEYRRNCCDTNKNGCFMVARMTLLTVTEYMCHKWPRIRSVCRNNNPVLSSFILPVQPYSPFVYVFTDSYSNTNIFLRKPNKSKTKTMFHTKLWKVDSYVFVCLCVWGVYFASFYDFDIWFWNCSDSVGTFCFSFHH
jgi:hypothetical protein